MMSHLSKSRPETLDWFTALSRLEGAYADETLRAYRADIATFVTWAEERRYAPFPAHPEMIAAFVRKQAETHASSTIKRRLAALNKIHRLLRVDNSVDDEEVRLALRRAYRQKKSRPSQAKGLTSDIRDKLLDACLNDLSGKRNKAIISVGYDTLARRSELINVDFDDITILPDGFGQIIIRRAKNDQLGMGRIASITPHTIETINQWLQAANISEGPIFRSLKNQKISSSRIHPSSVNRILKQVATSAKLDRNIINSLSGHSMRVGAAQDMMANGIQLMSIMAAGGWKTINVVARYVENTNINEIMKDFHQRLRLKKPHIKIN